jgi:hypothetical protein
LDRWVVEASRRIAMRRPILDESSAKPNQFRAAKLTPKKQEEYEPE